MAKNSREETVTVTGRSPSEPELQDIRWGNPRPQRSSAKLVQMDFCGIEARICLAMGSSVVPS